MAKEVSVHSFPGWPRDLISAFLSGAGAAVCICGVEDVAVLDHVVYIRELSSL